MVRLIHEAPSKLGIAGLWRRIERRTVPIIILHGLLPDADSSPFNSSGKFMAPEKLRSFLERIARVFRVVSAQDLADAIASGRHLNNAMVITFDDGYANTYAFGLPLLHSMGLPFTVFVTTGFLDSDRVLWNDLLEFAVFTTARAVIPRGILADDVEIGTRERRRAAIARLKDRLKRQPRDIALAHVEKLCGDLDADLQSPTLADVRFMTSDQVRRLSQAGVIIGGHSVTHCILSREKPERARAEVVDCKRVLEAVAGKTVSLFAYPNGRPEDFNDAVKADLAGAGYRAAFTTIHGLHRPGDNVFEIKRISVMNDWTYPEFETRVTGVLKALRR